MVKAARAYLTRRYAHGLEQMLWEDDAYPIGDMEAIEAVRVAAIAATTTDRLPGADLAAALVLVQAARLDLDRLEAKMLQAAQDAELSWDAIASILGLASPELAEEHFRQMTKRESEAIDPPRQHRLTGRREQHPDRPSATAGTDDKRDVG